VILLDTHVLLWLDSDAPQLGLEARRRIEQAWRSDQVVVSAISFWEVAMLEKRGRITLESTPRQWRDDWCAAGLKERPVDAPVALTAVALEAFHADPADRFIVATALTEQALLISADLAILNWSNGSLNRLDARH
jgi:PIN domain nuclease of toxin-antitoxin system